MTFKPILLGWCTISIIFTVLIVQQCDAYKFGIGRISMPRVSIPRVSIPRVSIPRVSSSGHGLSSVGNNGGSWSSSGSRPSAAANAEYLMNAAVRNKVHASAPRHEEQPIRWNAPGSNNPGAPPAYSKTHTIELSSMEKPPSYSKYTPPGHITLQSNDNPAGRSSSGSYLTNSLLAGNGLYYNAIRPYPSYSDGIGGYGRSTAHNNQAVGTNPNAVQTPEEAIPFNQNMNADQTHPPPTLLPNEKITDLDCVYAMKILNCSDIMKCPQEWLHPSCLYRTIFKEYYESITLPPPPMEIQPETILNTDPSLSSNLMNTGQNQNENQDQNSDSSNEQLRALSSSVPSSEAVSTQRRTGYQKAK